MHFIFVTPFNLVLQLIVTCYEKNVCGLHALVLYQCWHSHNPACWICSFVLFLFLLVISSPKVRCILTTSAAMSETVKFFNFLPFFFLCCLFGPWFCHLAGIPKTQSPSSTISSLKRPLASMSSPAAPMMLGISMMRKTTISSGPPPQLHPCHQACTLHPQRTRWLQDIIFITEQLRALSWSEMKGDILLCFLCPPSSSRIRQATQKAGCHTDWHLLAQELKTSRMCRRRMQTASISMERLSSVIVRPISTRPQVCAQCAAAVH